MKKLDRERVNACLVEVVKHRTTVTASEAHRRIYAQLGLDFGGPTIAHYLKALGFERVREGVYQRMAA